MKFTIQVIRVGFSVCRFLVRARGIAEASSLGLQLAYDTVFNEDHYEYFLDCDLPARPEEYGEKWYDHSPSLPTGEMAALYEVEVERLGYRVAYVDVDAEDLPSAKRLACDEVIENFSSEKSSEYFVTNVCRSE